MTDSLKVHLGSGPHLMAGWVNVDHNPDFQPDIVADLTERFPFEDNSVDYIHSEACLCQFKLKDGQHFLNECFRILKPEGVMRVLTVDLFQLIDAYMNDMQRGEQRLVDLWNNEVHIPLLVNTGAEVINFAIGDLHGFVYDKKTLVAVLKSCGFEAEQVSYQQSRSVVLRNLDVRTPENSKTLYFDCHKLVSS